MIPFIRSSTAANGISGQSTMLRTPKTSTDRMVKKAVSKTRSLTTRPTARLTMLSSKARIFVSRLLPGYVMMRRQGAKSVRSKIGTENARDMPVSIFWVFLAACDQPCPYHQTNNWRAIIVMIVTPLWFWRRDRDSNPGYRCRHTRVPGVPLQPLGHLSIDRITTGPLINQSVLFNMSPFCAANCKIRFVCNFDSIIQNPLANS